MKYNVNKQLTQKCRKKNLIFREIIFTKNFRENNKSDLALCINFVMKNYGCGHIPFPMFSFSCTPMESFSNLFRIFASTFRETKLSSKN